MVGCFADVRGDRALPILYANHRDTIDWNNMNDTVKKCADDADKNGKESFIMQD